MTSPCAIPVVRLAGMDLHPILGLASIVRMPTTAIPDFVVQTHADPDLANLCMQMFYVLRALGQHEFALDMQSKALQRPCLYRISGPSSQGLYKIDEI